MVLQEKEKEKECVVEDIRYNPHTDWKVQLLIIGIVERR